ncbi:hypothetical protein CYIG_00052 [Cyanophage NATL1A-7]|uniref:Predicted protein n=1 Tax=Cyanophage NATL1A-7 TaxID=445693 RepID=E3SNC1_9CAUD|nr:hypothetical protein CYIG_00052 [Cyanophage NATL1A-7]ADP00125.1 predicted protein [Cyanophage NATL1A-7]
MARSITRKQQERNKKTKKKKQTNREKLQAAIPGVMYKGSGKDPAVRELLKKLKKDGPGSLDSSGMGTRWKV